MATLKRGQFVISLDFELGWGVRTAYPDGGYDDHLRGVRKAVPALLSLFDEFDVHATWATVGLICFDSAAEARRALPAVRSGVVADEHCPYHLLESGQAFDESLHFAPELIERIAAQPGQELASHTFSHHPGLLGGRHPEVLRADLEAAVAAFSPFGVRPTSLVFPWNEWIPTALPVLTECGFTAFRGTEAGWPYPVARELHSHPPRRAARLLDAYLKVTGHQVDAAAASASGGPLNVPASRFLRPYSPSFAALDPLRLRRITAAMTAAAKTGGRFHLWWHPHNFGVHLEENLAFLRQVLRHFSRLRSKRGFETMMIAEATSASRASS